MDEIMDTAEFRGVPLDSPWKFFRVISYTLLTEMLLEHSRTFTDLIHEQLQKVYDMNILPCKSVIRKLLHTILKLKAESDRVQAYDLLVTLSAKGFVVDDAMIAVSCWCILYA